MPTKTGDDIIGLHSTQANIGAPLDADLSSSLPGMSTQGLTPNVMVLSLDKRFNVARQQDYTLMDNAWEVYVGRFAGANQDALFLYDRILGEARMVSFNASLQVTHYQKVHNLSGNWEVYSGDFNGSGNAQVLMYDPSSGDARFLLFKKSDLSLAAQKSYSGWQTNQVLYVGHFGLSTLSVMLYDPQAGGVGFLAFNKSLKIVQQYSVQNWNNHWQILVGAFVDRSRCLAAKNCSTGDDILVLDRKTGQIQQYLFSFGRQFQVFDNRVQPFVREGLAPVTNSHLNMVNTTSFSLIATLQTSIHGEELY
jgi:hypothetical protein